MEKVSRLYSTNFLLQRFKPCVYCYLSNDVINKHMNCIIKIKQIWRELSDMRIVFPQIPRNLIRLDKSMRNVRTIFNSPGKGFYFDPNDQIFANDYELQTIRYLRELLFDYDFLTLSRET